jgi:hypothetical protein
VTGLSPNIYKINVIKFNLKHLHDDSYQILDQDTEIKEVTNIKFLGLGTEKIWNGTLTLSK